MKSSIFHLLLPLASLAFSEKVQASVPACFSQLPSFEDLIERVQPACVTVLITYKVPGVPKSEITKEVIDQILASRGITPENATEALRESIAQQLASEKFVQTTASGFIIDAKEGYVCSNLQLASNAHSLGISLHDGTKLDARLLGNDDRTGMAVFQADLPANQTAITWGSSNTVKPGAWALSLANPSGRAHVASAGIIAAAHRDRESNSTVMLQTDFYPGEDSNGGALFNLEGAVIGIYTGGSDGLGTAIPADEARRLCDELIQTGHVSRGYLGIVFHPLDVALREGLQKQDVGDLSFQGNLGVQITSVEKYMPADAAGLQIGDVIAKFNGKDVKPENLAGFVAKTKPGDKVELTVVRLINDKAVVLKVLVEMVAPKQQQPNADTLHFVI